VECYGIDIDERKVEAINNQRIPIEDIEPVLPEGLCDWNLIHATTDWRSIVEDENINIFFVAVPTERDGEPWWEPLRDVVEKLSIRNHDPRLLVIIESTMAVGTVDELVSPYIKNVAVAPRRDWFTEPSRNLKTLPRIVGGTDKWVNTRARNILSQVCNELISCDYREAELVKAYENAYRHVTCVLAQEMALAYPNINTRKVMELAGTKWNVESIYPNMMGTGGYCVPLSSKYILEGTKNSDNLTIIRDTVIRDDEIVEIFEILNKYDSIGCLGLSYIGNIKVHVLSSLMRLLRVIDHNKIYVNDPLYTEKEITNITGCQSFKFPDNLDRFEVILLLAAHDKYKDVDDSQLVQKTENCRFIFDNTGLWKHIKFKCPYYLSGQANWMGFLCD